MSPPVRGNPMTYSGRGIGVCECRAIRKSLLGAQPIGEQPQHRAMQHEHPARVELRLVPQGLQENLEWLMKGLCRRNPIDPSAVESVTQRNGSRAVGLGHKRVGQAVAARNSLCAASMAVSSSPLRSHEPAFTVSAI